MVPSPHATIPLICSSPVYANKAAVDSHREETKCNNNPVFIDQVYILDQFLHSYLIYVVQPFLVIISKNRELHSGGFL